MSGEGDDGVNLLSLLLVLFIITSELLNAFTSNILSLSKICFYTFSENFMIFKQWYKV